MDALASARIGETSPLPQAILTSSERSYPRAPNVRAQPRKLSELVYRVGHVAHSKSYTYAARLRRIQVVGVRMVCRYADRMTSF